MKATRGLRLHGGGGCPASGSSGRDLPGAAPRRIPASRGVSPPRVPGESLKVTNCCH